MLPQRPRTLVLQILEACTTCLSKSLFVPNLFVLRLTLTRPCLYQTLTYLCLNFTQHKCTLPHMYQTQMYTVLNIPNLYLPNLPHCFSSWAEFSIFDFSILNFTFWGLERLRVPACNHPWLFVHWGICVCQVRLGHSHRLPIIFAHLLSS